MERSAAAAAAQDCTVTSLNGEGSRVKCCTGAYANQLGETTGRFAYIGGGCLV